MYLKIADRFVIARSHGRTLGEMLGRRDGLTVMINGYASVNWPDYKPLDQDVILVEPQVGFPAIGAVIAAIMQAIVSMVVSMLLQFLASALMPKPKQPNTPKNEAQRFGVSGLDNTIEEGLPKIMVLGERRVWPHIIGSRTDVAEDGKSMKFAVLGLVGDGGTDGWEDIYDPEINDAPVTNYPGVTWEYRLGTQDQTVIEGFEDVQQVWSDNRTIPNLVELQSLEIQGTPTAGTWNITVPDFGTTADLSYNADAAAVQAALRAISGLTSVEVIEEGTAPNRIFSVSFEGTTGDIDLMTVTDTFTPTKAKIHVDTIRKGSGGSASGIVYSSHNEVERMTAIIMAPSIATIEYGKATMRIKVERKLSSNGGWTEVDGSPVVCTGKTTAMKFWPFVVDMPSKDYWDLRFSLVKSNSASQPQLFNVQETSFTTLTYPGNVLVCLRGVGSGQIQSLSTMKWSFKCKGMKVKRPVIVGGNWDGSTYETVYTEQRMWHVRFLMTHQKCGLGHRIAESMFDDWAAIDVQNYLDQQVSIDGSTEIRDLCDGVVNEQRPGWNWITEDFLGEAACGIFPSGRKLKPWVSQPKSPNMLWAYPANILDDEGGPVKTLIAYPSKSINTLRGTYPDEEEEHAHATTKAVEVQLETIGTDPIRPDSYQFDTVVRKSQVVRQLTYLLKKAQVTSRRTWQTGAAGQVLEIGDVDYLSDDKANNIRGWQGKCPAGSTTTVLMLSRKITLEGGKTYEAIVRHQSNNITERRDISTAAGTVGKVTVSTAFSTAPAEEDIWAVGEKNVAIIKVVHESITMVEGRFRIVSALYDAALWGDVEAPPPPLLRFFGSQSYYPPIPLHDAQIAQMQVNGYDGTVTMTLIFDVTPGFSLLAGKAQGGAASWIQLATNAVAIDDYYNTATIKILDGAAAGQERDIIDFTASNLHAVPSVDFNPAPGADTHYEVRFNRFGNYKGFRLEVARDTNSPFELVAVVDGTHHEIVTKNQGVTEVYRFAPISTENIINETARIVRTITIYADIEPPGLPTDVTVIGGFQQCTIEWTVPTDNDWDVIEIWRSTTNDSSTAGRVGEHRGILWTDTKLDNATTYYYWLRSRDRTGNLSEFHTSQYAGTSGTTLRIQNADVADREIAAIKLLLDPLSLVDNPNFDYGSKGWTSGEQWYFDLTGGHTSNGRAFTYVAISWLQSTVYFAVAPGQQFFISGWLVGQSAGNGSVNLVWTDKDGNYISASGGNTVSGDDAWHRSSAIVTAPANAAFGHFIFAIGGNTVGQYWIVDEAYVARAVIAELIVANQIDSTHLRTDVAVITQTAQIANGIIQNAQIADATIQSGKIANLVADKLVAYSAIANTIYVNNDRFQLRGGSRDMVIYDENGQLRTWLGKIGGTAADYGLRVLNASGGVMYNFSDGVQIGGLANGAVSVQDTFSNDTGIDIIDGTDPISYELADITINSSGRPIIILASFTANGGGLIEVRRGATVGGTLICSQPINSGSASIIAFETPGSGSQTYKAWITTPGESEPTYQLSYRHMIAIELTT